MMRSCIGAFALTVLAVTAHAQGKPVQLKNSNDSLSYAIGGQIGNNVRQDLRRAGFEGLNMDLLKAGFADGTDSTMKAPVDKLDEVVRTMVAQKRNEQMAKDQAAAEANLKIGQDWLAQNGKKPGVITTASGLQYEVVTAGTGPLPSVDSQVEVNYRGTLTNGFEFDSSYKRGQPAQFGLKGVIPGWTEVLQLMPEGSKWKVYIPSELAYGPRGNGGDIPGNSVLVFDLELLKVLTNCQPKATK